MRASVLLVLVVVVVREFVLLASVVLPASMAVVVGHIQGLETAAAEIAAVSLVKPSVRFEVVVVMGPTWVFEFEAVEPGPEAQKKFQVEQVPGVESDQLAL